MSITFNNTYPAGYVGEDDGLPTNSISLDQLSTNAITVVGTVRQVGDPVTVTGVLPDAGDVGTPTTNPTTLYVTQFDNTGQILFSNYNSAPGQTAPANPYRYVFSNTPLTAGKAGRVTLASDPALVNGTSGDVYAVPACFVTGTQILAVRAGVVVEIAVEDLRAGDLAVTACGTHRPIRWIGRRSYSGVFANRNPHLLPVRFAAGSLGDNVPSRDLSVSPKHAMVLDGVLVPAEHLVNGTTIARVQRVEVLEYFHVELESHDVLFAEGAASESYVEDNNRDIFHNAADYRAANPDAVPVEAVYCLPRVEEGFALEAIRQRLASRADALVGTSADRVALHGVDRAA